jgi:zeta toxin
MKKIKINQYPQRDRQMLQEHVARSVERDPEQYLQRYVEDPRSFEGRYVNSDLMKEMFPEFAISNEARARYNNPVHNAAAVLAHEQYSRAINDSTHPERDQAILVTGVPGAGKSTAIANAGIVPGQLPDDIRVIYEGQLSNSETAIPKIQEAVDAGLATTIVAVNIQPEVALLNTIERFENEGRGASIHAMATIQSGLPNGLQSIYERFGDQVNLTILDRSESMNNTTQFTGWDNLYRLEKGTYEEIRQKLESALDEQLAQNNISEDAYRQAIGDPTVGIGKDIYREHGAGAEQLQTQEGEKSESFLSVLEPPVQAAIETSPGHTISPQLDHVEELSHLATEIGTDGGGISHDEGLEIDDDDGQYLSL